MLLSALLQDWLPKDHLTYFINDTVDALDLKMFYARYAGGGARNQRRQCACRPRSEGRHSDEALMANTRSSSMETSTFTISQEYARPC